MARSAGQVLAIDLGTATTRVHVQGPGIVLAEPTVAAAGLDRLVGASGGGADAEVVALGADAVRLVARAQEQVTLVSALAAGRISDFDVAERMVRYAMDRARAVGRGGSRVVLCLPGTITGVERRALALVAEAVGARDVQTVEPTVAVARAAELPIDESAHALVAVLGAGVTEVAVLADSGRSRGIRGRYGIVAEESIDIGGAALDEEIASWLRTKHSLLVGAHAAEQTKIAIGSAWPGDEDKVVDVRGRQLGSGSPQSVTVSTAEIRAALAEPVAELVSAVRRVVDRCPPEIATDVVQRGVVLAGGGALLTGFAERLRRDTGMPVSIVDRPIESVVVGAAALLADEPSA